MYDIIVLTSKNFLFDLFFWQIVRLSDVIYLIDRCGKKKYGEVIFIYCSIYKQNSPPVLLQLDIKCEFFNFCNGIRIIIYYSMMFTRS